MAMKTSDALQRALDLKVEYVQVGDLKPYPHNARTHSKKQIRQLAESMKRFGFVNATLIGDNNEIMAGHGRVEAAKLLGLEEIPTIRLSHLSAEERRAYILADNQLATKAGWDRELLAIELQFLADAQFDLDCTGFEAPEIDLILGEARERTVESGPEDEVPTPPSTMPITNPGDVWHLGSHRLVCGDARDPGAYEALLQGEIVDAVITDPPYNVNILGHVSGLGKIKHVEFGFASGEMSESEFTAFLAAFMGLAIAHSKDGALHYICMDDAHAFELLSAARQVGLSFKITCTWAKTNGGMGSLYRKQCEFVHVFKVGTAPHVNNVELGRHGRNRTTLWSYAGVNTFRKGRSEELAMHLTVKPVQLVADAILDCSKRSDLVLDPFLGSGTTLIAAEKTGRRGRGIEYDPFYCDVIVRRWQAYTGKQAKLAATGQSFEQVEEQRRAANDDAVRMTSSCEPCVGEAA
jgi:DNA modification methylase